MKKLATVLLFFTITWLLSGCGKTINFSDTTNNKQPVIKTSQAEIQDTTINSKNTLQATTQRDTAILQNEQINNSTINPQLSSSDQKENKISDTQGCFLGYGDKKKVGHYTLSVEDSTIDIGQLEFGQGLYSDEIDYFTVAGTNILVYYQYEDCASIRAYFVSYDEKKGLAPMVIYNPLTKKEDKYVLMVDRLDHKAISKQGFITSIHPNGLGIPYQYYLQLQDGETLVYSAFGQSDRTDYSLKPISSDEGSIQPTTITLLDLDAYENIPLLGHQPAFLQKNYIHVLDDYTQKHNPVSDNKLTNTFSQGETGALVMHYQEKYTKSFPNMIYYDIYEFADASSFDYIIRVQRDNETIAVYSHVQSYTISENGRYIYINNYEYNEYLDHREERNFVFATDTEVTEQLEPHSCRSYLDTQEFMGDTLLGISISDQNTGLVPTTLCLYSIKTKEIKTYKVPTQWMACSMSCPIDTLYYDESNQILLIKREDYQGVGISELSSYDLSNQEIIKQYHVSFVSLKDNQNIINQLWDNHKSTLNTTMTLLDYILLLP